jgi:hypothetical protein
MPLTLPCPGRALTDRNRILSIFRISAETAQRRLDSLAGTGTLHPEALRQATEAMGCFSDKPIVMYS